MQISIYFIVAAYSIFFALKRLSKPGMSAEIKKIFMSKQISYVIIYLTMWSCFFIHAVVSLMAELKKDKEREKYFRWSETFQDLSMFSAISTGLVISFVRIREPYLLFLIK